MLIFRPDRAGASDHGSLGLTVAANEPAEQVAHMSGFGRCLSWVRNALQSGTTDMRLAELYAS
jgi:hypothetical protein